MKSYVAILLHKRLLRALSAMRHLDNTTFVNERWVLNAEVDDI